jgi:hypothetical protein
LWLGTKYIHHATDYHVTMSHVENKLTPRETQNSLHNTGNTVFPSINRLVEVSRLINPEILVEMEVDATSPALKLNKLPDLIINI